MTACDLLGFRFSPAAFALMGAHTISPDTQRILESRSNSLKAVAERHGRYQIKTPEAVSKIVRRFYVAVDDRTETETLTNAFPLRRDRRRLARSLCVEVDQMEWISRSPHFPRALTLFEDEPSASITLALFDTLLRNWENREVADLLRQSLLDRVLDYSGRREQVTFIKEKAEYFLESAGAVRLAGHMAAKEIPLTEVWEIVRQPAYSRCYEFFSVVAEAYVHFLSRRPGFINQIPSITRFLSDHEREKGQKAVFSALVHALASSQHDDISRDFVLSAAVRLIGDPARRPAWAPWEGATSDQSVRLEDARRILNQWIAHRFIVAFFEKVAMDQDRREFWLRYAPHVDRFKIFGDTESRFHLRKDERLRGFVDDRFQVIGGNVSALLMEIRGMRIVEFSRNGNACYVFKHTNSSAPSFDKRYDDLSAFRPRANRTLLYESSGANIYSLREEGRVLHQPPGMWQVKFAKWFRRALNV